MTEKVSRTEKTIARNNIGDQQIGEILHSTKSTKSNKGTHPKKPTQVKPKKHIKTGKMQRTQSNRTHHPAKQEQKELPIEKVLAVHIPNRNHLSENQVF